LLAGNGGPTGTDALGESSFTPCVKFRLSSRVRGDAWESGGLVLAGGATAEEEARRVTCAYVAGVTSGVAKAIADGSIADFTPASTLVEGPGSLGVGTGAAGGSGTPAAPAAFSFCGPRKICGPTFAETAGAMPPGASGREREKDSGAISRRGGGRIQRAAALEVGRSAALRRRNAVPFRRRPAACSSSAEPGPLGGPGASRRPPRPRRASAASAGTSIDPVGLPACGEIAPRSFPALRSIAESIALGR
jgi:hypothetical protein